MGYIRLCGTNTRRNYAKLFSLICLHYIFVDAKTPNRDSTVTLNFDSTGKKEDSDTGSIMIQTEGIEQPISEGSDTVDALNRETNL